MIQRIQTLYLTLATIFSGILLKGRIFSLVGLEGESYELNFKGIFLISNIDSKLIEKSLPLSILMIIVPILFFVAIFLYKRRKLQIRVTVLSALLSIGVFLLIIYYMIFAGKKLEAEFILRIKMVFPIISAVFGYLAFRGILKDELLIKSYDRIR
jgi:hypothetical protein